VTLSRRPPEPGRQLGQAWSAPPGREKLTWFDDTYKKAGARIETVQMRRIRGRWFVGDMTAPVGRTISVDSGTLNVPEEGLASRCARAGGG